MRRKGFPIRSVFSGVAVTTLAIVVATPADAESETRISANPSHCVTVVAGLEPGVSHSKILSRACAPSTEAANLQRPEDPLVVVFWSDENYTGDSEEVYGDSGPCDEEGYGFNDMSDILDGGTSSYTLHGGCTQAEYFSEPDMEGTWSKLIPGNQTIVPGGWNDAIGSMSIHA